MSTEFVGIELQLMGADGVRRDLESLDRLLRSLGGRKKFDAGFTEARQQVIAYKGELEKLKREYGSIISENKKVISNSKDSAKALSDTYKKGLISLKEYKEAFHQLATQSREAAASNKEMNAEIDATRQKMWNAQQAVREFSQANREAGKTFMQTFNAISSKVAHIGSAMQSFGNALTQLASPFRRFTSGILMGAGYKALNSFTEGFERGFTRYDTMKKYPKIMAAFGYSAKEAQDSIDALDISVRGLPTGLDEMVDLAQRFTATTGDIQKGTKLAIATNNAFLASMSTDTQRYQGMMQLQDVLGGKDMNAREWNSLVSSMTPAIVKMGESLGYTSKNMDEFIQTVRDGKMDNQKFIDQLIKIGNEGGVLEAMAQESKDTWQAFFANVGNAAARMTAGVIKSLDEVVKALNLKDKDGKKIESVNRLFSDRIIPAIDSTTASVQKWIQANPDVIVNFFRNLSRIKVGDLLRGYAKGLGFMASMVEKLGTALGKHPKGMAVLGWLFGAGGTVGRLFTIGGGLLKGLRHPIAAIGAGGAWLFKGRFGGLFGKIVQIFGKKKTIEEAGEVAKDIPSIANTFKGAFKSLQGMMSVAGGILIASGTGFVAAKSFKSVVKDIGDIISTASEIDWNKGAGAITAMGTFFAAFAGLGKFASMDMAAVGEILAGEVGVGLLTTVAAGIADLDMFFIKDAFKKFKEVTDYLNQSVDNLRNLKNIKDIGDVKSRISNVIEAMQQVYSSLKIKDDEGRSLMSASTQEMNEMQGIIGGMSNILGSIGTINKSMLKLSKSKLIDRDTAISVGEQIGGILEGLGEAFHSYLSTEFGYNPTELTAGMATTIGNFNKTFAILTGEEGLFANLRRVQSDLREIPGVQTIGSTLSNVKAWMTGEGGLFQQLKDISTEANKITNADTVATKMGNFATAFESLRVIFKKLKNIKKLTAGYKGGDIPGMSAVRNLISQLSSAFNTETVNQVNSQISSFMTQVTSLLDTVKSINDNGGNIEITIKLTDKIIGKDKVISDIEDLAKDIQAAVDKIKSYYYKHVTVDVIGNAKFRQSGNGWERLGGDDGTLRANGGMIYRAKGGSVGFPGRPIGTDRIPAWLSAGEFVQNKRAVSAFGIDFMRKVNNLDMKGAMNELMHRAGHMANINRGTSITNNYNNNQKVVINNSNAGAGYTFKTASRFVGAF